MQTKLLRQSDLTDGALTGCLLFDQPRQPGRGGRNIRRAPHTADANGPQDEWCRICYANQGSVAMKPYGAGLHLVPAVADIPPVFTARMLTRSVICAEAVTTVPRRQPRPDGRCYARPVTAARRRLSSLVSGTVSASRDGCGIVNSRK